MRTKTGSKASQAKSAPRRPPRGAPTALYDGRVLHFRSALNAKDLAALDEYLASPAVRGEMFDAILHDSTDTQYGSRKCDAAWLKFGDLPAQRKLRTLVKAANDRWQLLPSTKAGFRCEYEDAQYTEYRGDREAHFKQWHLDAHDGGEDAEDSRAITLIILLAEPEVDFEGGDLEIMRPRWPGGQASAVQWKRGDVIAFPACEVWHRVMPTTKGLRRTIVVWAKDPTAHARNREARNAEADAEIALARNPPPVIDVISTDNIVHGSRKRRRPDYAGLNAELSDAASDDGGAYAAPADPAPAPRSSPEDDDSDDDFDA